MFCGQNIIRDKEVGNSRSLISALPEISNQEEINTISQHCFSKILAFVGESAWLLGLIWNSHIARHVHYERHQTQ